MRIWTTIKLISMLTILCGVVLALIQMLAECKGIDMGGLGFILILTGGSMAMVTNEILFRMVKDKSRKDNNQVK